MKVSEDLMNRMLKGFQKGFLNLASLTETFLKVSSIKNQWAAFIYMCSQFIIVRIRRRRRKRPM